jgi:hypothetical protein
LAKDTTRTLVVAGALCALLSPSAAEAQTIPPVAERDPNWDAVSTVTMLLGVGTVSLMPRVYYSSPDATVGWKARWHFSMFAPAMSLTAITLLVDGPIRDAIQSPKDGCSVDDTLARLSDNGCETFGGPSTHAFASWSAAGAGLSIFLVDTIKYSDIEFHAGGFIGNVAVPITTAILSSVARSADGSGIGPEGTGQVVAGALTGAGAGLLLGFAYAMFQEPDCGYGGFLFCW